MFKKLLSIAIALVVMGASSYVLACGGGAKSSMPKDHKLNMKKAQHRMIDRNWRAELGREQLSFMEIGESANVESGDLQSQLLEYPEMGESLNLSSDLVSKDLFEYQEMMVCDMKQAWERKKDFCS